MTDASGIDPTPVVDTVGDPTTPGTVVNDTPVVDPAPADPTPVSDPAPADPTPVSDPAPADPTPVSDPELETVFEDTVTTTTTTTEKVEEEVPVRREYSVQPGDTITGIATRLKIEGGPSALYAANRSVIGADPNVIFPGQVLVLP
jgi:nucleoid-associated protein YgaU